MSELRQLIKEARKYFPPTSISDTDFVKAILQAVIVKGKENETWKNF